MSSYPIDSDVSVHTKVNHLDANVFGFRNGLIRKHAAYDTFYKMRPDSRYLLRNMIGKSFIVAFKVNIASIYLYNRLKR